MKIGFVPLTIWGDDQTLVGFSDWAMENPEARERIVEAIKQACWKRANLPATRKFDEGAEIEFDLDLMGFRYELAGRWYGNLVVESIEKIAKIDEFAPDEGGTILVEDYREQRKRQNNEYASW